MALKYPNRDSFAFSIKSLEVRKGSALWKGLLSAKVNISIEGREYAYGTGMIAYSKTRGELHVECEFEWEGTAYAEYIKDKPNLLCIMEDITLSLREGSNSLKIEIIGLTIEKLDIPVDGTGPVKVSKTGSAFNVKINDQPMVEGDALGQSGEAGAA